MVTELSTERKVALCYVRESWSVKDEDGNSPERQRYNIEQVLAQHDWIPEWYEDVGGHRSGRSVKHRPAWQALEARLKDPDVVALVTNDMARLHRKLWRIGGLIEISEEYDVRLIAAAPDREVDTSTPKGRLFIQLLAMVDEFYAEDIAQRSRDSIHYRKAQGKTVSQAPFGTTRDEAGYLIPHPEGAWLMPDGTQVAGKDRDKPPHKDALWRGYHEAAERMLSIYSEGSTGICTIAYMMNEEGWAFRDREGQPRPLNRSDVRRVVTNWRKYGGIVTDGRAKDTPGYKIDDVDKLPFVEERAVFPIELLKAVGRVQQVRSVEPLRYANTRYHYPYPLSGVMYCAECDRAAAKHNDPRRRSRLGGRGASPKSHFYPRYAHKAGVLCDTETRSVLVEEVEADFAHLLEKLTIDPEHLEELVEIAREIDKKRFADDHEMQNRKTQAIALAKRRLQAAIDLYKDGAISREEYIDLRNKHEREIETWVRVTSEVKELNLELEICIRSFNSIAQVWKDSEPLEQRKMVRSLFDEIIYDFDQARIVGFKLKPWAERFLITRSNMPPGGDFGDQKAKYLPLNRVGIGVPPRGLEPLFRP